MCEFDRFHKDYDLIHNRNGRISEESSDYFSEYKVKELNSFFLKDKIDKRVKILDVGYATGINTEASIFVLSLDKGLWHRSLLEVY